ncbi:hypothetical protein [Parvibaculum sp.]|uniref:hypothetical protein n=1 Tax=Parvibaculum sp. TaxID=2024848 RepID=UPI00320E5D6B
MRDHIGLAHAYMLLVQRDCRSPLSPSEELAAQKRLREALCLGALQGFALRDGDSRPVAVGNPRAFNVPASFLSSLFNTGRVPRVRGKPILLDAIAPYIDSEFFVDKAEFEQWLSPPIPTEEPPQSVVDAPLSPSKKAGIKRKTGKKPVVFPRVRQAMRADVENGVDLNSMKIEEMKSKYDASGDICTKARNTVLAELAPKNAENSGK